MALISTDAEINAVRLKEQVGDPATPASGYGKLYLKSAGAYFIDDAGTVIGPLVGASALPASQAIFSIEGSLSVGAGVIRIRNRTGRTLTISEVHCEVNTAPVGAAIIVDVHKGGVTIFTTQSNRPQIADGANVGSSTTIEVPAWANDAYLTVDRDQVGSTTSGSDLVVTVVYS